MAKLLMFQCTNFPYFGVGYICGAVKAAGHQFKKVYWHANAVS